MKITVFQSTGSKEPTVLNSIERVEVNTTIGKDLKTLTVVYAFDSTGTGRRFKNVENFKLTPEDIKKAKSLDDFMHFLFEHLGEGKEPTDEEIIEFVDNMNEKDLIKSVALMRAFIK